MVLGGPLQKGHLSPQRGLDPQVEEAQTPGPLLLWASLTSKLWFWHLPHSSGSLLRHLSQASVSRDYGVPCVQDLSLYNVTALTLTLRLPRPSGLQIFHKIEQRAPETWLLPRGVPFVRTWHPSFFSEVFHNTFKQQLLFPNLLHFIRAFCKWLHDH